MAPDIAIIGGGPCGLTLARLLELKGINYTVYERDAGPSAVRAGGSLDIHADTGQRVLQDCGLLDAFKKLARYEDTIFRITDKDGNVCFELGQGRDAPEIDRAELRDILLGSVPKDKIRWGYGLASAEKDEGGRPVLTFANGEVLKGFKLVVGADGSWSKVRHLVTDARPIYTGRSYLEARIRPDSPLYTTMTTIAGAGLRVTVSDHKQLITQRQGDRSYRLYFGFSTPEASLRDGTFALEDVAATRAQLLDDKLYGTWGAVHRDMAAHAQDFRMWPLYSLALESQAWETVPGVALAGDAAHVTVPNGEGVNLAMFDAGKLVEKLVEYPEDWDRAVKEYEVELLKRGIESIEQGELWGKLMFYKDPTAMVEMMRSMVEGGGPDNA